LFRQFNVLHIHATDGQSLPVESTRYPNLTKYINPSLLCTAYDVGESDECSQHISHHTVQHRAAWGKKAVYSHADLHDIVQHAWERGIRVIPEWEMPGHAYGYVHIRVTSSILT
jgi:N-acetyl-beta-hexosaminidase